MRGHWGHHHHIGHHWGRHHGWRHHRGGVVWFWPGMILLFLLLFGVLKFLWPLLLIGFIFLAVKGVHRSTQWQHPADWDAKPKNDEKPKRDAVDDRRYLQTEDGDWLEII